MSTLRSPVWRTAVVVWTAYGLVHAALWAMMPRTASDRWTWLVGYSLAIAWWWALLTPLVLRWAAWASSQPTRARAAVLHVVAALALCIGNVGYRWLVLRYFSTYRPRPIGVQLALWSDLNVATYAAIALIGHSIAQYRRLRDRARRTLALGAQLARAQLHFLELQLQPHFLFNCLNAVSEYAHEAPATAVRMLRHLAALVQRAGRDAARGEVTLAEELEGLEHYLDLQRARFGDWLRIEQDVSAEARRALLPPMLLQPLVENAIRHGLAPRPEGGRIELLARVEGTTVELRVRDEGSGALALDGAHGAHGALGARRGSRGIGLANTRRRLEVMYPGRATLEVRPRDEGGAEVAITLPFHTEPYAAPASAATAGAAAVTPPDEALEDAPSAEVASTHPRPPSAVPRPSSPTLPLVAGFAVFWAAWGGIWLLLGLVQYWAAGRPVRLMPMEIRGHLFSAAFWAALTPLVLLLARYVRVAGPRWALAVLVHAMAAVAISVVHILSFDVTGIWKGSWAPGNLGQLAWNVIFYFALVAWWHARTFARERLERDLAADRLQASIADARWQALRVRVRPETVLGALERLGALVRGDVPRAERLIARLADLLRLTLDASDERTAPLHRQLALLGALVDVTGAASGRVARLVLDIEPGLGQAELPSGVLLAMADDLLAAPHESGAELSVGAARAGRGVRLSVSLAGSNRRQTDDGAWSATREAVALARHDFDLALDLGDARASLTIRARDDAAGRAGREQAEALCRSA